MRQSPGVAVLISLLVPGLSHILAGRGVRGGIAFAITVGMFAVGYSIVGAHLWYYEVMPPGGMFAFLRHVPLQLLPEFANMGCSIAVGVTRATDTPELLRLMRMPVEGGYLGTMLTGLSGIVSCLWAVDAYWLALDRRARTVTPACAVAVSWLIPGGGHVLAGQKSKGLLLGAAVIVVFVIGQGFSFGHAVDRFDHSLWWAGQSFCGIGVIFSSLVTSPWKMTTYPEFHDLGLILCTVAGLMNLMVMTDAYTVAERQSEPVGAGGGGVSLLLRFLILVPITFLIMIVYSAPGQTDASGVVRLAVRKTGKVVFWVVVIVVVMQLLQLAFLP